MGTLAKLMAGIVVLAFVVTTGVAGAIAGMAYWKTGWTAFALAAILIAPIFTQCPSRDNVRQVLADHYQSWIDIGYFITGTLITTGVFLPLVLLQTQVVPVGAALTTVFGGLIAYSAIIIYQHYVHFVTFEGEDDMF